MDQRLNLLQLELNELKKELGKLKKEEFTIEQIERITDVVEKYYNLPNKSVRIRTRKREIVDARRISMVLVGAILGLSSGGVGRALGGWDHASVLYSIKEVKNLFQTNSIIHNDIIQICHKLNLDDNFITKLFSYDNSDRENSA